MSRSDLIRTQVGVDEVGRGCLAGPVYAAACILDDEKLNNLAPSKLALIRDSKTLTAAKRKIAFEIIQSVTIEWHVAFATVEEIDEFNILEATFVAMCRALKKFQTPFDEVMVDGNQKIKNWPGNQTCVVGGDSIVRAIAAASILAKVTRDTYMSEQAQIYDHYLFEQNAGYGTKAHLTALNQFGPTPLHRRSFAPVKDLYKNATTYL